MKQDNVAADIKRLEAEITELRLDLMIYLRELNAKIDEVAKALPKARPKPSTAELMDATTLTAKLIAKHFSRGELDVLIAEFHINHEDIPGVTLSEKAAEFAGYMNRRSRLGQLVKRCVELRPDAYGWPIQEIDEY